jgi:hypothetical protein
VRNLESGQTHSFSINQVAERKKVKADQIAAQYNDLEKIMLKKFFDYLDSHLKCNDFS